jgi:hypothetical protein
MEPSYVKNAREEEYKKFEKLLPEIRNIVFSYLEEENACPRCSLQLSWRRGFAHANCMECRKEYLVQVHPTCNSVEVINDKFVFCIQHFHKSPVCDF